jgi:hypothetical protein
MSLPLFKTLISIPWPTLLKRAPSLVRAAEALLSGAPKGAGDAAGLGERVAALEAHDRRDAELVKQLAEQVEALTLTVRIMAAREKVLFWIVGLGFPLAFGALVLALLRR